MPAPRGKLGRVLALAILAAALAGVGLFLILPLWELDRELDDRIAAAQRRLDSERRIAGAGTDLAPRLERLRLAYASDARFLKSPSEALAGAELQGIAQRLIPPRGGSILSTQVVSGEREHGFPRVVLRVKMRATLEQAVEIFHALETGTPYLFVDNLSIAGNAVPPRPSTRVVSAPSLLQLEFDLAGYLRGEAP